MHAPGCLRHGLAIACLLLLRLPGAAGLEPARSLTNTVFVVIDIETTGLSATSGRIVELAAVRLRGGRVEARRSWLVNPGRPIPEAARRVHGISDEMVKEAPGFAEVAPEFLAFAGDAILLAHNALFDARFLREELTRNGCDPPGLPVFDTLRLAKAWFPGQSSYRLEALSQALELEGTTFHRALADADRTAALFLAGIATMPPGATVEDLVRLAGKPRRLADEE